MPRNLTIDSSILEAALIGYQHQRDEIDVKMAEIRRQIGGQTPQASGSAGTVEAPRKRVLSAAARKRMGAAQRKRWAEFKKAKEARMVKKSVLIQVFPYQPLGMSSQLGSGPIF